MPELNYNISFTAEVGALRQLEKQLIQQIIQAKAAGKSWSDYATQLGAVQGRLDKISFFKRAGAEMMQFASRIPGVGAVMTALNGAAGAASVAFLGVSAALGVAAKALREFSAYEREVFTVDAALANRGLLSKETSARMTELASKMQDLTAIDDSEWLRVITTLTKFGADTSKMDQYIETVENLAGLLGGDLQQAAGLFARAMNGSFEMLSKYGIHVREDGTQTEKLADLMLQAARGAGILRAQADSLSGRMAALKNNLADAMKTLGGALAVRMSGFLTTLADSTKAFAQFLGAPAVNSGLSNRPVLRSADSSAIEKSLADNISASAEWLKKFNTEAERRVTLIRQAAEGEKALADAQLENQLAKLKAQNLPLEQEAKRELELREQARQKKLGAEQRADVETLQELSKRIQVGALGALVLRQKESTAKEQAQQRAALDAEAKPLFERQKAVKGWIAHLEAVQSETLPPDSPMEDKRKLELTKKAAAEELVNKKKELADLDAKIEAINKRAEPLPTVETAKGVANKSSAAAAEQEKRVAADKEQFRATQERINAREQVSKLESDTEKTKSDAETDKVRKRQAASRADLEDTLAAAEAEKRGNKESQRAAEERIKLRRYEKEAKEAGIEKPMDYARQRVAAERQQEKTGPGRGPAPLILSSWQRMGALGGLLQGAAPDPARRSADALDEIKKQLAKGVNVLNQPKTTGAVAQ